MQYNQGRVTVNIPDEFSLKDQDRSKLIEDDLNKIIGEL